MKTDTKIATVLRQFIGTTDVFTYSMHPYFTLVLYQYLMVWLLLMFIFLLVVCYCTVYVQSLSLCFFFVSRNLYSFSNKLQFLDIHFEIGRENLFLITFLHDYRVQSRIYVTKWMCLVSVSFYSSLPNWTNP